MDSQNYRAWQELHLRAARGEALNASEQADYEAGCQELDADETLDGDLDRLRKLRELIGSAESAKRQLRDQEANLDARIAALEDRLDTRTRQLLGIGT